MFFSLKRMKMVLERAAGAEKMGFGGSKIEKILSSPPPFLGRCLERRGGTQTFFEIHKGTTLRNFSRPQAENFPGFCVVNACFLW